MHLFTSLIILCLALSLSSRQPGTFRLNSDDGLIYEAAKDVLRYNMRSGSLCAKGHLNALMDVEDLGAVIAGDGGAVVDYESWQTEVDQWVSQLIESESMSYFPDS